MSHPKLNVYDGNAVTNAIFLQEVYRNARPDEVRWTLSHRLATPSWAGQFGGKPPENAEADNYFCVATLAAGADRREADHFAAAHVVVLDDVDPNQHAAPSYVIETSPGNYQAGYLLTVPMRDAARYARLMKVLGKRAGNDNSGNNVVRVVRLPVGLNTKREHINADGEHARCRLVVWRPGERYTFEDLEKMFKVDTAPLTAGDDEYATGMPEAEFERLCENIRTGVDLHDSINRVAARMVARGSHPADVKALLRELMHATSVERRDDRWLQRYVDIARSVDSAAEKFAPEVEEVKAGVGGSAVDRLVMDFGWPERRRAQEFVFSHVLAAGITILASYPAGGKTSTMTTLAVQAAGAWVVETGGPALEVKVHRHVVYYAEDPRQVVMLLEGMIELGWVDAAVARERIHVRATRRVAPAVLRQLGEVVAADPALRLTNHREGRRYDAAPWVVFDTTNATIEMESENANSEMGAAVSALREGFLDVPVTLITHVSKALKNETNVSALTARGAGALEADAQQVLFLTVEDIGDGEDARFINIEGAKHRFIAAANALTIDTEIVDLVCYDEFDLPCVERVRVCRVTPVTREERVEAREEREEIQREAEGLVAQEAVLRAMVALGATQGVAKTAEHCAVNATQVAAVVAEAREAKRDDCRDAIRALVDRGVLLKLKVTPEMRERLGQMQGLNNYLSFNPAALAPAGSPEMPRVGRFVLPERDPE